MELQEFVSVLLLMLIMRFSRTNLKSKNIVTRSKTEIYPKKCAPWKLPGNQHTFHY